MAIIGLIGDGNPGSITSRIAIGAGYIVAMSNIRGPETLKELIEEFGISARAVIVK